MSIAFNLSDQVCVYRATDDSGVVLYNQYNNCTLVFDIKFKAAVDWLTVHGVFSFGDFEAQNSQLSVEETALLWSNLVDNHFLQERH